MLVSVPMHLPGAGMLPSVPYAVNGGVGPAPNWSVSTPLSAVLPAGVQVSSALLAPIPQPTPAALGMVLSSVAGALLQKLIDKVKSGQFVEMREFLMDNMLLLDRLESVPGLSLLPALSLGHHPCLHEVSDPVSWVSCFLAYVAILTSDCRPGAVSVCQVDSG